MGLPSFLKSSSALTAGPVTPSDEAVKTAIREAAAEADMTDKLVDGLHAPATEPPETGNDLRARLKLDKLVKDDFPFDESQLEMIEGVVSHLVHNGGQGACATGAAGTGKTTSTKKIVDRLIEEADFLRAVDMESYFKKGDPEPDEEPTSRWVPSIAMVGFTGRSTQMIKKNFPRSWHGNIMTIHRCLAFMPVWEEQYDDELGEMRNRMRFEPTFNAMNRLPWDIIIIDEAGMLGLDLWEQLRLALKPSCKVIMIGDINQLPPVHGRSVFGFAMGSWPAWELTHVHRQQDSQDRIVDMAWRILKGQKPESGGNFQMVKFDELATKASQQVRKFLPTITEKGVYDPIRDSTITATNGEDGQRGFALGQKPLNREFAIIFNKDNPRYIIDAGRERQKFAVGDKVMATRNDHEQGITNGMTGIIQDISENGAWAGDRRRFGTVESVNAFMREMDEEEVDLGEISVDDMLESYGAQEQGRKDAKESKERGPASHIVTVKFGEGESAFEIAFATLAEVASLMTAYVVTCHKMQGGESPVVVIILHTAHKAMHFREWLYTAVTRGSEKVILLYTDQALRNVLTKQKIKGSTLAQKVESFLALSREGLTGAAVKVNLAWGAMSQLPAERPTTELSDSPIGADTDLAEPNAEYAESEQDRLNRETFERMQREARIHQAKMQRLMYELMLMMMRSPVHDIDRATESVIDMGYLTPEDSYKATKVVQMFQPPATPLLPYYPPVTGWPADLEYVESLTESLTDTPEAASEPEAKPVEKPKSPHEAALQKALAQISGAKAQTIPSTPVPAKPGSLAFLIKKQKG